MPQEEEVEEIFVAVLMINSNTNHVYFMRIYFCNSIIVSFCSSSFAFDITKAPFAESRLLGR